MNEDATTPGRGLGVIASAFVGLIVGGLVGGGLFLVWSGDKQSLKTEDDAIPVVVGMTRRHDGFTFGEYVRQRYMQEVKCPGADRKEIRFSAMNTEKHPDDKRAPWRIIAQYQGTLPRDCRLNEIGFLAAVAMVDPLTKTVVPASADYDEGHARPTWLVEFRNGR